MNRKPPPRRKSPRKYGYDYTQPGGYFVTICTHHRDHLFGEIIDRQMHRNAWGNVAAACWQAIPEHFPHSAIDSFVIMPNHIHGILFVDEGNTYTLGQIINVFKGAVTREINRTRPEHERDPIWQRNFHDTIIKDDAMLVQLREYMRQNPARWQEDRFFI